MSGSAAGFAFLSEAGYRQAIDATLASAKEEIRVLDRNLESMALEDANRIDRLSAFLSEQPKHRLRIVLHNPDRLQQSSPRLINLLRNHSRAVEIRLMPERLRHLSDCQILADGKHGTLRFHADQPRGKLVVDDAETIAPWWLRYDELWQISTQFSPAIPLGL